jgi:hypothetical protein
MGVRPGDKIKIIKEYSGYPGTLGKIFTVFCVNRSGDGGVDTVERNKYGNRYIICGDEYEKINPNPQLTFIFSGEL